MAATYSDFARSIKTETAFDVLAVAKELKAQGKNVYELEIGDSPFPSTTAAVEAGIRSVNAGNHRYCASAGLPDFRTAAAEFVQREYGISVGPEHIVVGAGAKPFELFFCEVFLNPGDGVLVFSPYFPTYVPNIARRGARIRFSDLKQEREFRPNLEDVEHFLDEDPRPKAIFLNSPHNPTGGVALPEDLRGLADLVRGRNVAIFSDEPYDQMVWRGEHHSILSEEGMLDQAVAAYTFSKSYSMSGWRLGFAVSSPATAKLIGMLINTALSCTPPFVQHAGIAALQEDAQERDQRMAVFRDNVRLLVEGLNTVEGIHCLEPGGTFYVFPSVAPICQAHGITSHGLAMYLLEGADEQTGIACLGGECFGEAGHGFVRFSCAEPAERLQAAMEFLPDALSRKERIAAYLEQHPEYRLSTS